MNNCYYEKYNDNDNDNDIPNLVVFNRCNTRITDLI